MDSKCLNLGMERHCLRYCHHGSNMLRRQDASGQGIVMIVLRGVLRLALSFGCRKEWFILEKQLGMDVWLLDL